MRAQPREIAARCATAARPALPTLHVVTASEYSQAVRRMGERILLEIRHGETSGGDTPWPCVRTALTPLTGDAALVELWLSAGTMQRGICAGLQVACDGHFLFAATHMPLGPNDGTANPARTAYEALTRDVLAGGTYPWLLRAWNVIPHINRTEPGAAAQGAHSERYRQFCVGRHEGIATRIVPTQLPAGTGVGSRGTEAVMWFLAARAAGVQIENPRQVSAYRYPERYGPRSPSFARATLVRGEHEAVLLVSGTASIVGHRSVHVGDDKASVRRQTRESLANIDALLHEARKAGAHALQVRDGSYKVYVRHARHAAAVREVVESTLGGLPVIYLQADICRADLNVEIEAVVRRFHTEANTATDTTVAQGPHTSRRVTPGNTSGLSATEQSQEMPKRGQANDHGEPWTKR